MTACAWVSYGTISLVETWDAEKRKISPKQQSYLHLQCTVKGVDGKLSQPAVYLPFYYALSYMEMDRKRLEEGDKGGEGVNINCIKDSIPPQLTWKLSSSKG